MEGKILWVTLQEFLEAYLRMHLTLCPVQEDFLAGSGKSTLVYFRSLPLTGRILGCSFSKDS